MFTIGCTNLLSLKTLYLHDRVCLPLIVLSVIKDQHMNCDIYFYWKINIGIKVFCAPTQFKRSTFTRFSIVLSLSFVLISLLLFVVEWVDNSCTKATVNRTVLTSSVDQTKHSVLVMNLMYWYRLHCLHCRD